jgi:hypothetical protein
MKQLVFLKCILELYQNCHAARYISCFVIHCSEAVQFEPKRAIYDTVYHRYVINLV